MKSSMLLLAFFTIAVGIAIGRPNAELRFIKTSKTDSGRWVDENAINALIQNDIRFMDLTDLVEPSPNRVQSTSEIPDSPQYQSIVNPALQYLSAARIQSFIQTFSSYYNRYYQSQTGVESANWVLQQVNQFISSVNYTGNVSVYPYEHTGWIQPSIIARIEGADPSLKSQVVIVGAHADTILSGNPTGNSPGADDNASGSSVVFETLRAILQANFIPKRSIEFHWYAAEEVGLRGSGAIASDYYNSGVDVVSMLNFDVVGYYVEGVTGINLIEDLTDLTLNVFLQKLITEYCNVPWRWEYCGYACTDHASWDRYNFRAGSPAEPVLFPDMHTTRDTIDRVSFVQILEFAKLASAYVIELGLPL